MRPGCAPISLRIKNCAQVPGHSPFLTFENGALAVEPEADPCHALPEVERRVCVLLKLRYLRPSSMFTGRKLALSVAFTVLVALATGVSCKGFFVQPTLTSLAINPTAPSVDVGQQETLSVYGTYDDGSRSVLSSGVSWSSDTPTVATVGASTGVLAGVAPGSAGITASAQALSASASATVVLTGATLAVTPTTETVALSGTAAPFTFTATAGSVVVDITTDNGGTLTITPASTDLTCTPSGGTEVCSADSSTALGAYTLTMTYPGATNTISATLTVTD